MGKLSFADNLKKIFGLHNKIDDNFFEELTDSLIEGDIAAKTALAIEDSLRTLCKERKVADSSSLPDLLTEILLPFVKETKLEPEANKTNVYLVLGVNGVGKTTSIAKLAKHYKDSSGFNVVMAAADTFRAAAIEQLKFHGNAIDVRVVAHQSGADPAAVVFDSCEAVRASGGGLVLVDTAGRLHNKGNLVRELQKIDRIASQKADPNCYKKVLVLDATTGQNGFRQAETFHEAIALDAVILTKYDSVAKGGVALSVSKELGLPIAFVGNGEKYENLYPFDASNYVKGFVGIKEH